MTKQIIDWEAQNHQHIKFLIRVGDSELEEIIAYSELSDIVERQHEAEANGEMDVWLFKGVLDHKGPLTSSSSHYKGSSYNVLVQWEDGTKTWEPLNIIAKDDPVTLAQYAKDHDLLDKPGWKFLRKIARREKLFKRMVNQARLKSKKAVRYKFGVRVPRTVKEAIEIDIENGNTFWQDAISLELAQLFDYLTFHSIGKGTKIPEGYQYI